MPYQGMTAEHIWVEGHNGDGINAYLARPLGAGPFPAVMLFHHMPGWDEASKEMARKFAHNGYIAIMPNLHYRQGHDDPVANSNSIREAGGMPDDRTLGDAEGSHQLPPPPVQLQWQGGHHRVLLRRAPGVPGRVQTQGPQRSGGLLGRRRDPTGQRASHGRHASRAHRVRQRPVVSAAGDFRRGRRATFSR